MWGRPNWCIWPAASGSGAHSDSVIVRYFCGEKKQAISGMGRGRWDIIFQEKEETRENRGGEQREEIERRRGTGEEEKRRERARFHRGRERENAVR